MMLDPRVALTAACRARGINSREDFRLRFGIAPDALTPQAALALATTPDWVTDIWLRAADPTPVVWVPAAVRSYAGAFGIAQDPDESDQAFNNRLKAAIAGRTTSAGRDRGPPTRSRSNLFTGSVGPARRSAPVVERRW